MIQEVEILGAVNRVLRHIKESYGKGLWFKANERYVMPIELVALMIED
jgi:hypothetical protein